MTFWDGVGSGQTFFCSFRTHAVPTIWCCAPIVPCGMETASSSFRLDPRTPMGNGWNVDVSSGFSSRQGRKLTLRGHLGAYVTCWVRDSMSCVVTAYCIHHLESTYRRRLGGTKTSRSRSRLVYPSSLGLVLFSAVPFYRVDINVAYAVIVMEFTRRLNHLDWSPTGCSYLWQCFLRS